MDWTQYVWNDYKNGFGLLHEEHWMGLDNIHAITTQVSNEGTPLAGIVNMIIPLHDIRTLIVHKPYHRYEVMQWFIQMLIRTLHVESNINLLITRVVTR